MEWGIPKDFGAMSYEEAEAFLLELPKHTSKNNLEDTKRFLKVLGSPEESCHILHVAGTNGKGSVCAYLCSVIMESGGTAGMFISPHLETVRERISIGNEWISEEDFMTVFERVQQAAKVLNHGHEFFFKAAHCFIAQQGIG